jgi:RimJ/RimL family protein N-acetyltransferase
MLAEAFADPRVDAVIARTLPERNASNRVLEKAGFRFACSTTERDRPVWRFEPSRSRPGTDGEARGATVIAPASPLSRCCSAR